MRLTARLSERTLERRGWVVASVRMDVPASVSLEITRSGSRLILVRMTGSGVAQEARVLIRRRIEARRLSRGRHIVNVMARAGERSATTKLPLIVR